MTTEEHTKVWDAAVNNTVKCVLEIIDEEDQNRRNELGVAYDGGSITVADRIRNRVLALKGEQE